MTARQLARVGLALLGIYLIVEALISGTHSLTGRPFMVRPGGDELPAILNSALVSAAMALAGVLLYGILPGAILIAKSRAWAESWFPESPTFAEMPLTVLLPLGLLLLGLNFGIHGAAGLLGGTVRVYTSEGWSVPYALQTVAASAVSLVAGIALFVVGRRLITWPPQ